MIVHARGGDSAALQQSIRNIVRSVDSQMPVEFASMSTLAGATQGNVFWLVLKQGQMLTLIGAAIGLGASYAAGRFISSRLYEVSASDPLILIGATLVVALLASLATMIPALRASKTKPAEVLRS